VALAFITTSMGNSFLRNRRACKPRRPEPSAGQIGAAPRHPSIAFDMVGLRELRQRVQLPVALEDGKVMNCGRSHWLRGLTA